MSCFVHVRTPSYAPLRLTTLRVGNMRRMGSPMIRDAACIALLASRRGRPRQRGDRRAHRSRRERGSHRARPVDRFLEVPVHVHRRSGDRADGLVDRAELRQPAARRPSRRSLRRGLGAAFRADGRPRPSRSHDLRGSARDEEVLDDGAADPRRRDHRGPVRAAHDDEHPQRFAARVSLRRADERPRAHRDELHADVRDMGLVPWREVAQLSDNDSCFVPSVIVMQQNGADPLDP